MIAVCLDGNHWTDVRFVRVGYYGFDMCPVHWEREFEERFHEIALYVEENEDAYVHTRYALPPNPPEDIVPTLEWGEDPRQW